MASFIVLSVLIIAMMVMGNEFSGISDAEIDQLLKKLNKPALKSIKSPDGDIIDCVHMKNHPIYDHPLFKNHTIQMRPSSYPEGWANELSDTKKQSMVAQLWTINGKCPKNSIPIRRTKREDILRAKSIEIFGKKDPNSIPQLKKENSPGNRSTHEVHIYHSIIKVNSPRQKFHGAKAGINVWKPYVQTPREFSLAQMWVLAGTPTTLNSIEAGWQVYQNYYGDDYPRYFAYWTADGYNRTGCYNLRCPGFVPVSQVVALGAAVPRVSILDGEQDVFLTTIWKDSHTGNWWLKFGSNIIGYWPSSLFNRLQTGATRVQWGGEITNYKEGSQHTTTNMGSGQFAEQGFKKASYFRNLEILDENDITKPPTNPSPIMTAANCYNIRPGIHPRDGVFFFYGGPGRNPNCI
ncbi:hypothetical protein EUTSA_v10027787mg [Eutrema salsugineum]|uniref:Neprosin PEP catalytic domain-containing protein n=1 Tax=Eutrema salsugineum TaxID=72664 RepID=V4NLG8_EUTSA|nr:hypothetical protein EUTSA_v10027787mg [Eutrema salsugineum]